MDDYDFDDVIPINGWSTMRATAISSDGVTDFVLFHLVHQETDETWTFSASIDTATRLGFDLLGDGLGAFMTQD